MSFNLQINKLQNILLKMLYFKMYIVITINSESLKRTLNYSNNLIIIQILIKLLVKADILVLHPILPQIKLIPVSTVPLVYLVTSITPIVTLNTLITPIHQ